MKNIKLTILIAVLGLLIQAQTSFAQTAAEFVERAQAAQDQKDWVGMVKNAGEAIKQDSSNYVAFYLRAIAYNLQKKNAEALADTEKVIQLKPNLGNGYYLHGVCLMELRPADWRIALADYNKAIELKPTLVYAFRERAYIHNEFDNNLNAALADASEAIKLDAEFGQAYFERGKTNQMLKNWIDAESDFSNAIKFGATYAQAYNHRGIVNLILSLKNSDQTKLDQAIADFRQALKLTPDNSQIKENLDEALSKNPINPPATSTSSNSAAIMLGFYNLYNKTYDNAMPKAEKLFQKLKTHRYPAPQIIVVDPHCNYCLKTTTEVNKYKSDQKEFAQNLLRALDAMRAILNNSDVKELTAEQRQYCQDRLDKAVALENEAGAWFAKH